MVRTGIPKLVTVAVMSVENPASLLKKNESLNEDPGKIGKKTIWLIDAPVVSESNSTDLVPVWAASGGAVKTFTIPVDVQGASNPVSNPGFTKSCGIEIILSCFHE